MLNLARDPPAACRRPWRSSSSSGRPVARPRLLLRPRVAAVAPASACRLRALLASALRGRSARPSSRIRCCSTTTYEAPPIVGVARFVELHLVDRLARRLHSERQQALQVLAAGELVVGADVLGDDLHQLLGAGEELSSTPTCCLAWRRKSCWRAARYDVVVGVAEAHVVERVGSRRASGSRP